MYEWLFAAPGTVPREWNAEHALGRLQRSTHAGLAVVLVADSADRLLGFCTVYLDFESARFGLRAWAEDLAVDPEHRSRGIGKQLLDAAKEWARGHGATHLELESAETRKDAHRFYEREHPSWRAVRFRWDL
jgi:GNAT superfamily N-acetyltransferase